MKTGFLNTNILVFDDLKDAGERLQDTLRDHYFNVAFCDDPKVVIERADLEQPDMVILVGNKSIDVLRHIRQIYSKPILAVSKQNNDIDHVMCLEMGADNYVALDTVSNRILLTKIRALLSSYSRLLTVKEESRTGTIIELDFEDGDLVIQRADRLVLVKGKPVKFTPIEYAMLWYMASNYHKVQTRDDISLSLKGIPSEGGDRSIDVVMTRIRRKIGDTLGEPKYIKTVRGKGYLFFKQPSLEVKYKEQR